MRSMAQDREIGRGNDNRGSLRAFSLFHMGACDPAINWAGNHESYSRYDLWRKCPKGSWLLWLLGYLQLPNADLEKECGELLDAYGDVSLGAFFRGEASREVDLECAKLIRRRVSWKTVKDKLKARGI
jgi:hypothetical protein